MDERVVIVEWDEKTTDLIKEPIISDYTLQILLKKIQQQKPSLIGLDLYRDFSVDSPHLSDQNNLLARKSLNKLFKNNSNLIGIEKVIKPIIYAPSFLEQDNRTAASDIPTDQDGIVRRTYIYPQVAENGQDAAGKPYIGIKLAYEYLKNQGWQEKKGENLSLVLFQNRDKIILKPLKSFLASQDYDEFSLNILVNWRKSKLPFNRISIEKVLNDQVSPFLFKDKIILIGNTSAATGDRHSLPQSRFNYSMTPGVEVVAQVTSSVISAALDKRPLINPISEIIEFLVVIIANSLLYLIFHKYQKLRTIKLYLFTFVSTTILTILLFLCSLIVFSKGFWMPITNSIGSIWSVWFFINFYLLREKEQKRVVLLEMFTRDLQHSLGNPLNSIVSSSERIGIVTEELKDRFNIENTPQEVIEFNSQNISSLNTINKRLLNLKKQVSRIERYQRRTREFVDFAHLSNIDISGKVNISLFVSEIVDKIINENELDYYVDLEQNYDNSPKLKNVKIDQAAIEIVLENLLCNALYSVSPQGNNNPQHIPVVKIKTKLINKKIQFSIEDNGVGIPKKLQQKIFEPFVSFSYRQGLGLYLTKKILMLHKGNITVESKLGEGSKFIFTIPLSSKNV